VTPIRFAVLGCGSVVKKHLVSLERIEEAQAVAVCDKSPEVARKVGEQYGLPYYSDPHRLLSDNEVDVISILTPTGIHADNIRELLQYGKDFLVEKPLALRLEDADEIIAACDQAGSRIFVVHQNRCNLPIVKLRQAIDNGRFGKLVLVTARVRWCRRHDYSAASKWRGTWSMDGGVLTNQASHHLDMVSWLGGTVQSVMAMTSTRLVDIEAEDTAVALIEFTNGALGIVEATTATRPKDLEGSLSVLGEGGSAVIGGFFMNKLETWQFENPLPEDEHVHSEWGTNPDIFSWNHTEYIRKVVRSLKEATGGLVDGLEGRKSLELINALYESAETGRKVQLRFQPQKCRLGTRS